MLESGETPCGTRYWGVEKNVEKKAGFPLENFTLKVFHRFPRIFHVMLTECCGKFCDQELMLLVMSRIMPAMVLSVSIRAWILFTEAMTVA